MKNKIVLSLLPICLFSLTGCNKWVSSHNPHNVMSDRYSEFTMTFDDKEYLISSQDVIVDSLKNKILNAGTYRNVANNNSATRKSFTYQVERSVLMWGRKRFKMEFYSDGYVDVYVDKYNDERRKLPDYYTYKFDSNKAEEIYNIAAEYATKCDEEEAQRQKEREEEKERKQNAAKEAQDKVYAFSIDDVINDLKKKQHQIVSFYFLDTTTNVTYYDNELEDDGSILDKVTSVTYIESNNINNQNINNRVCYVGIDGSVTLEDFKQPITYSLSIVEDPSYVNLTSTTKDSYGIVYNYTRKYKIDSESLKSLFDTAIKVYEQKHNDITGEA